ncbi:MAG TPA: hypothetical protein VIP09_02130 [Dehalococcoidia bacterium]
MPRAQIIIETPALAEVELPIVALADYEINRELNAAGSWAVSFPAPEPLAKQIKSRWRVSIMEEGRAGYLLRRGIVLDHTYRVAADGTAVVALTGMSRLYDLARQSTHQGLAFTGADIGSIANTLTGEAVTVPAGAATRKPIVTFNDESKLAALLSAIDLARYNIRETFNEDGFELVSQDNVPDSGFRFVNVEQAGPELDGAAANGMGVVAGTPTIGYDGKDVANRIIPVGADWDGKPLTLQYATTAAPYAVQVGTNPDSSSYYYLQDADSVTANNLIEMPYVRSDVKNPSNNSGTRQAAANALFAVTAGELIKRKSEVISFASLIANGNQIDALPGDRVRVQFRGVVRLDNGRTTYRDVDQDFLVVKRRDSASGGSGVRDVAFTVTAPDVPIVIPSLPNAVPIPPPPTPPRDPPKKDDNPPTPPTPGDTPPAGGGAPDQPPPPLPDPRVPTGNYQPCCAYPSADIKDGATPPPDMTCSGNFLVEWDAGVDGTGEPTYVLDVDTVATFATQTQYSTATHSQMVTGLVPGTTYYMRIESHYADTTIDYSVSITVSF